MYDALSNIVMIQFVWNFISGSRKLLDELIDIIGFKLCII